jgi:hypothetical protein
MMKGVTLEILAVTTVTSLVMTVFSLGFAMGAALGK